MSLNRRDFLKNSLMLAGGVLLPAELAGCAGKRDQKHDIVVYGGTSAGIIAAVAAARKGRSVILIEPSDQLGGLTTGGLGQTDLGIPGTIGGMSLEFYHRIRQYYENDTAWKQQTWDKFMTKTDRLQENSKGMFAFEPHVARKVYRQMLDQANVPIVMNDRLVRGKRGVEKRRNKLTAIETESGKMYRGQVFIDATYEGDLMAEAGISYTVGRESNTAYNETLNGVQRKRADLKYTRHVFKEQVDPYVTPGQPRSGLLPGIYTDIGAEGEADHKVQAYCFRLCLTDVPENQIPIQKPKDYDERQYELLFRNFEAGDKRLPWINSPMPNRKTDINNKGAVSTDYIGMNYDYPEGSYAKRSSIVEQHKIYQQGLLWSLANHPRVPESIRDEVSKWGLAADEFTDSYSWPPQLYIREARRMIGEYVMTEQDCRRMRVAEDSIGIGSYNMDSHSVQRYVTKKGSTQNEGLLEVSPGGPYAISYKSVTPRKNECTNLLVSGNGISASHAAFGSIRMEPIFMVLGQSVASAAGLALEQQKPVQDISYSDLKKRLLEEGQKVDIDLDKWPPEKYRD